MTGKNDKKQGVSVPLYKLFPSMITITALCLGLVSIRYTMDGKFMIAAILIIIAAVLDGLDGRIARLFNAVSEFGAQLDSLADLINFGLAPGILIYIWKLVEIPYRGFGWCVILLFVCCSAIRLARFNVDDATEKTALDNKESRLDSTEINSPPYFVGLPMPAAAVLSLFPLILSFELLVEISSINPYIVALYIAILAILMVSRVPVFSGKGVQIPKKYASLVIMALALLIGLSILEPWIILPILSLIYMAFIPISAIKFYKEQNK